MKTDLIAICGMPRAGTTFLHNLFADYKLGRDFFALHSRSGSGFASNPVSTCEPRYLNIYYIFNQPITHPIRIFTQYWRETIGNNDAAIIYKHPQLIFHGPIEEDFKFRIKYIFCMRKFISWRNSFLSFTKGGDPVNIHNTDSLYARYWGKEWKDPPGIEDRCEHLYVRMEHYIKEFKKQIREDQYADFIYDNPINSLENIFDMLDIEIDAMHMVNRYWRTKDI